MDELDRESHSAGGHELASEVSERIRTIISSAEAAANAVRHEAEQRAQVRRRVADEEARRIVDDARRDAEAFLAERIRRISELSDAVVERGEGIVMRLDRAEEVRRQLQGLADALGESAEELARELGGETPEGRMPERRTPPSAIAEEAAASAEPSEAAPAEPEPTASAAASETAAAPAEPRAGAADPEATASAAIDAASAEPEASASAPSATEDPEVAEAEIVDDPTVGELATEPVTEPASPRREPDDQLSARLVALQMAVAGGKRDEVETHLRRTFELRDVDSILDDVFGSGDDTGTSWPRASDGAA